MTPKAVRSSALTRGRVVTLQAIVFLLLARLLVAHVPFSRWRASLGKTVPPQPISAEVRRECNLVARRLARAVERAASRVAKGSRCLPRAMALQWLIRWYGMHAVINIGVLPSQRRGGLHDLHAWVVRDGEVLLGGEIDLYAVVYAAQSEDRGT